MDVWNLKQYFVSITREQLVLLGTGNKALRSRIQIYPIHAMNVLHFPHTKYSKKKKINPLDVYLHKKKMELIFFIFYKFFQGEFVLEKHLKYK